MGEIMLKFAQRGIAVIFSITVLISVIHGAGEALASPVAIIQEWQCDVSEPVCIMMVPDGSGMTFQEARTIEGEVVDATITVQIYLYDEYGPVGPLSGFSADDIGLHASEGMAHGCGQGWVTTADQNADSEGWMLFSLAPRAGGWSHEDTEMYIGVDPAMVFGSTDFFTLPIYFNSPDINGDRSVNLSDIVMFAEDLVAASAPFRSDLVWDGVINLSDIAVFSQHIGAVCP